MAEDSGNDIQQFNKSLVRDIGQPFIPKNSWTHARNCINNSSSGDLGDLGNEPANMHLIDAPYDIIGAIYMYDDVWAIYSTNDSASEIGIYKESTASYTRVVLDPENQCLNFNKKQLITGVARKNFDCTWSIYFANNHRNPDRVLNLDNVPYKGTYSFDTDGCRVFTPDEPLQLDCAKLRLNPPVKIPCMSVSKGSSGGSILNGSYCVSMAYTVNGQKVTSYAGLSNVCSVFEHGNRGSGLLITLSELDLDFDQYELVIISVINQQTVARRLGLYSTNQKTIALDVISDELIAVPLEFIPVHNPLLESSSAITELSDSLIRIAPRTKFDPNYQPRANQIETHWVSVEFPADYYRNGGTNTNFLHDENYALFIQWVYDDGDLTSSYPIPGRAPDSGEQDEVPGIYDPTYYFENVNTATLLDNSVIDLGNGGYQVAEGLMGYYETDERYPDNKPEVWGDLCGKKIRHHKFPDRSLTTRNNIYVDSGVSPIQGPVIRVNAIKLYNIQGPVDNDGNPIKNIVGYRILRGSRDGNKTIIAKGVVNNTFTYELTNQPGVVGVYPNYPFNSLEADPFISTTKTYTNAAGNLQDLNPNTYDSSNKFITFHSPDTNFKKPFLSGRELKLDGVVTGDALLEFKYPEGHPNHKLIKNVGFFIAAVGGLGLAVLKMNGKRTTSSLSPTLTGSSSLTPGGIALLVAGLALELNATNQTSTIDNTYNSYGDIVQARDNNVDGLRDNQQSATSQFAKASGMLSGGTNAYSYEGGLGKAIGGFFRTQSGLPLFVNNWAEGTDTTLDLIRNFSSYQQYALQQLAYCFYNGYAPVAPSRIYVEDAQYLGSSFQNFNANTKINNLYRASTVVMKLTNNVPDPADYDTSLRDTSKQSLQTIGGGIHQDPTNVLTKKVASSYYASLKLRLRNQYGQIGDVKQIPIGCVEDVTMDEVEDANNVFISSVIFGGDTYVTRYTEKNTMFFFYEWLFKQLDGFEYDYFVRRMLQYPAYWMNSKKFDTGDFLGGIATTLGGAIASVSGGGGNSAPNNFSNSVPTTLRALDKNNNAGQFVIKDGYFYLFSSSVKDFYVESDVNVGYRDWEEPITKRHYDTKTFTEIPQMFNANPDIIKADNFYKYDYSLSIGSLFTNTISWANVQPSYYNPQKAETCYTNHDARIAYSLPQQFEQIADAWRMFLVNNYRDFRSKVTWIESIGLTGAIIFFETDSPLQIQGVETLKTTTGTSITIGDGVLLQQASQSLTNADRPYQFGSCKDARSVVNTPAGLFWMSPDQGKIFTTAQGVMNIAMKELNWWFIKYLPYRLLVDFPNFDILNNPVSGIGCQTVYDNENNIIYFSKRDFRFKNESFRELGLNVIYTPGVGFSVVAQDPEEGEGGPGILNVGLHDPNYFEDVSWTVSYDVKTKQWLSWHDWHPDLVISSKQTFCTVKGQGIWKHNARCDKYCNYYGEDFPWEIEYEQHTGLDVTTLKSIEYYLEAYKYAPNCIDRYLYLTENFDRAIIYNNEQCSGLLKLALADFEDPFQNLQHPIFNLEDVSILYSKVENKYRFDMFYDMTDDRGMFTNARRQMWITAENGYVTELNPVNLNYQKAATQLKRFRGNVSQVFLSRKVSGDVKFLMLFSVNKTLESKR